MHEFNSERVLIVKSIPSLNDLHVFKVLQMDGVHVVATARSPSLRYACDINPVVRVGGILLIMAAHGGPGLSGYFSTQASLYNGSLGDINIKK